MGSMELNGTVFFRGRICCVKKERWQFGTVELQKSEGHRPLGMTKAWVSRQVALHLGKGGTVAAMRCAAMRCTCSLCRQRAVGCVGVHVNSPCFANGCAVVCHSTGEESSLESWRWRRMQRPIRNLFRLPPNCGLGGVTGRKRHTPTETRQA